MTVPVSMRRPPGAAGKEPWAAAGAAGALLACDVGGLFFRGGDSGSSAVINSGEWHFMQIQHPVTLPAG